MTRYCRYIVHVVAMSIMLFAPQLLCAQIDADAVAHLRSAAEYIESLSSYSYKLTNVTFRDGKKKNNVMRYSYKEPLTVRIEWLNPKRLRGQLAAFKDNKMRVVPAWLPFSVPVDPDSDLGHGDANYPIYSSSLGALMQQVIGDLPKATRVFPVERTDDAVVYEIINDTNKALIKIDRNTNLPLYIEQFTRDGTLIDGGYFEEFSPNPTYPDDFFDL